ncbi:hypothetical protein SESBI_13386 [Sesbania bispinosa]|nr:hypothetical protein SESBI_13386 [Sesbania bispinosa]
MKRGGRTSIDSGAREKEGVKSKGQRWWLFKEDGNPKFPLYWTQNHFCRRSKEYVFALSKLNREEVATVEALQAFKKKHGIQGCNRILNGGSRSLKDRLDDMEGNNMLALAEKRAKREAAKQAAADAIAAAAAADSSTPQSSHPGDTDPVRGLPEKRARTKELKDSHDSGKGVDSSTTLSSPQPSSGVPPSSRISWATPDPEEDAAMKLLGQQGRRVFKGSSASEMKDFLGQKYFEAVSKKLKDDEVKMKEALGKVKGLSDDNIKLTEKNNALLEEIEKLKLDLAAKKSDAIQAVLEKQKVAEELEASKGEWKLKAAEYEKEIQRVEDLWDESAECFFHNAIDQWYRGTGKYFVEELPGEAEITPSPLQPVPLEADAVREDKKGSTESEMVDVKILGLDDSRPPEEEADKPPADAAKE